MTVDHGVPAVQVYREFIQNLLNDLPDNSVSNNFEPAVTIPDLEGKLQALKIGSRHFQERNSADLTKQAQYAALETAFRDIFYDYLNTTTIDNPAFARVWKLLDVVSTFSDEEQCEPGLIFWLIEELLDSQTIDGCRKVFDFLESRRERITAKHFKQKSLIILRSCNELLRRLSRAEDTVFCGRVFVFLFQSFPLGDKSAVNLRGEFHTENVTSYDQCSPETDTGPGAMDVDTEEGKETHPPVSSDIEPESKTADGAEHADEVKQPKTPKVVTPRDDATSAALGFDALYPIFWSLQRDFCEPTRLFESQNFDIFKKSIEETISKFQTLATSHEARNTVKFNEERTRLGKRKRGSDGNAFASNFNPKYLTSRDLFELEVNDVAFRRHVLVQALILLDFLLSLTPKSKARVANMTNKSVLYSFTLSDEDTKWVTATRATIASYLQQGNDGKFYYRMVDTVLSRDKNWTRWKAQQCPLIEKPGVSSDDFQGAINSAKKTCAAKKLRAMPLGALDVSFLSEAEYENGFERLKDPERYVLPSIDKFKTPLENDALDIEMAKDHEERQSSENARASKTWRVLRVAAKSKLNIFDKIDDSKNLDALFEKPRSKADGSEASDENGDADTRAAATRRENEGSELAVQSQSETERPTSAEEKTVKSES